MVFKFLKSGYDKMKGALAKTRSILGNKLRSLFSGKIDAETLENLEQIFYEADLGIKTAGSLTEKVQAIYKKNPSLSGEELIEQIQHEVARVLKDQSTKIQMPKEGPLVILIVGVNGNGKTTSVAKLARTFKSEGKKVLLAATDTFRAAGMEQLELWAEKLDVDLVKGASKSDPAAVAFDALTAAKSRGSDVVVIDTAGRLHTRQDLMQELAKIRRACSKVVPDSPHETLLVLDATTGQNAIDQAKVFHEHTPITGLLLTKLDGTAKGGIVVNLHEELHLPVKFVGTGEGMDDLSPFDPDRFAEALLA